MDVIVLNSVDLLCLILLHLPLGSVALCRLVNRKWRDVISVTRAFQFWRSSYSSFMEKIMSIRLAHRLLLARGVWDVDCALDIERMVRVYVDDRRPEMLLEEGLMTVEQLESVRCIPHPGSFAGAEYRLLCDCGIIALRERLFNIEQLKNLPNDDYMRALLSFNGIAAVREHLITLEQVIAAPTAGHLFGIFRTNAYANDALRQHLVTIEQVMAVPNSFYLELFFSHKDVLNVLSEGLITLEEIAALSSYEEINPLIDARMLALRKKRVREERWK